MTLACIELAPSTAFVVDPWQPLPDRDLRWQSASNITMSVGEPEGDEEFDDFDENDFDDDFDDDFEEEIEDDEFESADPFQFDE